MDKRVASTWFLRGYAAAAGFQPIATVPDDRTWIVKSLYAHNAGGAPVTITLYLGEKNSGPSHPLVILPVSSLQTVTATLWVVATPADYLLVNASGAALFYYVSGSNLFGITD